MSSNFLQKYEKNHIKYNSSKIRVLETVKKLLDRKTTVRQTNLRFSDFKFPNYLSPMKIRTVIHCMAALLFAANLSAQSYLDKPVFAKIEQLTLFEIFGVLEKQTGVRICCDPKILPWYRVSYTFEGQTLYKVLGKVLPPAGLMYAKLDETWLAVVQPADLKGPTLRALGSRCKNGEIEMPEFLRPVKESVVVGDSTQRQPKVLLQGTVWDAEAHESIAGASISGADGQASVVTNALGQFSMRLPGGKHLLRVNMPGYRETQIALSAWQDGNVEINLVSVPQALQEVTIQGNAAMNRRNSTLTGVEALPVQTIRELPAFLGEADVIKGLNTLPGVSSAGDGASGFNVRGGNTDQNLTMQDEAPLFNTSHVLGFFSVYNPDLVRSVTLYKGHVPAQFGGRISSVLDVKIKDGDFKKFGGQVGVGLASARVFLEGPLIKDRVSILIGARRSYSDWMLRYVYAFEGSKSSAWFFDGLAKLSVRVGAQSLLSVSTYGTNDFFRYGETFGFRWSNRLVNASFRHPIGSQVASVWQVNAGRYRGGYFNVSGIDAFDLRNGLEYANAGWRATWTGLDGHELVAGFQANVTKGLPERVVPYDEESITKADTVQKDRGDDLALFIQDEWSLTSRLKLSLGLRHVTYRNRGEKWLYRYQEGVPRSPETIIDSVFYGKNEAIDVRNGLEPRVSANYKLNDRASLKLSYNRMRQYIHLISNLASPTPVDIWQLSTPYVAPQTGDNFDLGIVRDNSDYEFNSDLFFRVNRNVPVFRDLPRLLLNPTLETELIAARGRSYGAEVSLKKKKGYWTGWVNYTYVRAFVRTPVRTGQYVVNGGDWFPSDYDQPHQANLFAKFAWNPAASASFNFVYRRGRPTSGPQNNYSVGGIVIPDFARRNNLRIPDYFRVDFSLNFDQNRSKISGAKTSLNITFYNLIGRNNAYSVFFQKKNDTYPKAYKLAVIGACVPAIGFAISF